MGRRRSHLGSDIDVSFHIGPGLYNFVHVKDIGESNYRGRFVDRSNNYGIINNTTNITNITVNKTEVNNYYGNGGAGNNFQAVNAEGPPLNEVNALATQHVRTVHLIEANQAGPSTVQGNSLAVFAPRVAPPTAQEAKPANVAQTVNRPTFNRGDSITNPMNVTATMKSQLPTPQAIQAAQEAQTHAPVNAKIATESTPINTALSKPLTTLVPQVPAPPKSTPEAPVPNPPDATTVQPPAQANASNTPSPG